MNRTAVGRSILHLRGEGGGESSDRRELESLCRGVTPVWEMESDGLLLDLTGTTRLYGRGLDGAFRICCRFPESSRSLAAGVAPTTLAARLASLTASRMGGGVFLVPGTSVKSFLAAFPIEHLPGRRSRVRRLRELGVRTLGDLQVLPRDLLRSVFGRRGCDLADEATGLVSRPLCGAGGPRSDRGWVLDLVVGVTLHRPLTSRRAGNALRRGLAVRALDCCPAGPVSRRCWRLVAAWPDGSSHAAEVRSDAQAGWSAWGGLLELLWSRLPGRRRGLVRLELLAGPERGSGGRQASLFPDDEADRRLAGVFQRLRRQSGPVMVAASEEMLRAWGAEWFGPGADITKNGQGFG